MSEQMGKDDTALALPGGGGISLGAAPGMLGAYEPEPMTGGGRGGIGIAHVLRYKWTAVVTAMVVAILSLSAIWTLTVPEYAAKALVRVAPNIPKLIYKT